MAKKLHSALAHFPGEEKFVKYIEGLLQQADMIQQVMRTGFLAPNQQSIVQSLAGKQYQLTSGGGIEDAEMQRMAVVSAGYGESVDLHIAVLEAAISSKFYTLKHSDVLGAFMQLGIKREQFGDIVLTDAVLAVAVQKQIAPYFIDQVTQIHRQSVSFIPSHHAFARVQKCEDMTCILSSLRLDAIVAELYGCSREKAKLHIFNGFVKVNHSVIESADKVCNNKDMISIRYAGRFQLDSVPRMTKKGNYVVEVKKFV